MKNFVFYLFKLLGFWLLFFAVQQIVFLLFNLNLLKEPSFTEILLSFYFSFWLNVSASCYLISVPLILTIIASLTERKILIQKIIKIFSFFLIVINLLISAADIGLYLSWGSKSNLRAIESFSDPKEAFALIFSSENILLFLVVIIQSIFWIWFFKRFIRIEGPFNLSIIAKILFTILLPIILFLGIRGGWQTYPINKSWVYYSEFSVLNNSAINGFWNLAQVFFKKQTNENSYKFMDLSKAKAICHEMNLGKKDSTEIILTTSRPNIVLVILESFSADVVECLGIEKGTTPGIDSLSKDGILFTNFYSTGFRTDQGLVAMMSSFPAQPKTTIIKDFGKFDKLPNLISVLKENYYHTSYYSGGNLGFANTDIYLKSAGIQKLVGENDFVINKKTMWGAYDEELFDFHLKDSKNNKQPFFSTIMTSTSHEWFDGDFEKPWGTNTIYEKYRNAIHYTDKCLFEYINKAKTKEWYKNTLFVITADHAHYLPYNRKSNEPERHRIPFLLFGNVLKSEYRGIRIDKVGSQIDLAATILAQMKINSKKFHWSKNLFNKYANNFAFYTFDDGFGLVSEDQTIVYDHNLQRVVFEKSKISPKKAEEFIEKGKAYLETMYQEYIEFSAKK